MFEVEVWHKIKPDFKCPKEMPDRREYRRVTTLALGTHETFEAAAEFAFQITQNIKQTWKQGERSSSVGDLFYVRATTANVRGVMEAPLLFAVEGIGFRTFVPLNWNE